MSVLKMVLLLRCRWLSVNRVKRVTSRWGWSLGVSLLVCCCWLSSSDCCGRWDWQLCIGWVFLCFSTEAMIFSGLVFHSLASSRESTSSFSARRMMTHRASLTWMRCCEPSGEAAKATLDQTLEVLNSRKPFSLWTSQNCGLFLF